jgi:hypothetical protein
MTSPSVDASSTQSTCAARSTSSPTPAPSPKSWLTRTPPPRSTSRFRLSGRSPSTSTRGQPPARYADSGLLADRPRAVKDESRPIPFGGTASPRRVGRKAAGLAEPRAVTLLGCSAVSNAAPRVSEAWIGRPASPTTPTTTTNRPRWLSFAPFAHSVNSGRSEHRGGPSAERPKQRNALIWLPRPGLWARRSCGDNRSRRSCGHAGTNL